MTSKLSTTLKNVSAIPHRVNAEILKEFHDYLKEIGTSDNYQNQNLMRSLGSSKSTFPKWKNTRW